MCTMPTNPMNGMISCQLGDDGVLSYEDICTTTCNSGYEIQDGDAMRTCGSDRSFNGTDATCSRGKQQTSVVGPATVTTMCTYLHFIRVYMKVKL